MSEVPQKVACYCRVSTENQIENYSIDEQRERLYAFCKARGWSEPKMFIDPGYSGGNLDRPALRSLLEQVAAGKFQMVVVYKLDRLSRSQKDTLYLIEDVFNKNNVAFVSVCENFDTSTPFGKAMIGILSVFAQLEKDQITERFTMGRIGRAKNGLYHGGSTAPTGYDYVDGRLVMNPFIAAQVKEIFDRFMRGESMHSIQTNMHKLYGGWTNHTVIYYILQNSVYMGKVKFAGQEYDGEHEPIITPEQFYETQRLLTERSAAIPERIKTPFRAGFLLSGLVFCGNCGAKYHGNHGYYKCYSRAKCDHKYIVDPDCKNPNIKIPELDDYIKAEIYHAKTNPDAILNKSTTSDNSAEKRSALKKRLAEIEAQTNKLIDLYQLSNMPLDNVAERIKQLDAEKEHLTGQLNSLPQICCDTREEFRKNILRCNEILDIAPLDEQRMYIGSIIKQITIKPGGSVVIEWRI